MHASRQILYFAVSFIFSLWMVKRGCKSGKEKVNGMFWDLLNLAFFLMDWLGNYHQKHVDKRLQHLLIIVTRMKWSCLLYFYLLMLLFGILIQYFIKRHVFQCLTCHWQPFHPISDKCICQVNFRFTIICFKILNEYSFCR